MLDWEKLPAMAKSELAKLDIAEVNLACAVGLPGAHEFDAIRCLKRIDDLAANVRTYTEVSFNSTFLPRRERFGNSEAIFRVECMARVIQQNFKIRHHPEKRDVKIDDPYDLIDAFIPSALLGAGGTCGTIPVIYAAVGRRLGYPIKLACSIAHMFNRWDDPNAGECFNFEAANQGWSRQPDDYYRRFPVAMTPRMEKDFAYLKSMTPSQEVADMIARRGHIWHEAKNYGRAAVAYANAFVSDAMSPRFIAGLRDSLGRWKQDLLIRHGGRFPGAKVRFNLGIVPKVHLPNEILADLKYLDAMEICLHSKSRPDNITIEIKQELPCTTQP